MAVLHDTQKVMPKCVVTGHRLNTLPRSKTAKYAKILGTSSKSNKDRLIRTQRLREKKLFEFIIFFI